MGRLAEELGIHRQSLRRLRTGEVEEPSFPVVAKLFKLANRSLDRLVGIEIGEHQPLGESEQRQLAQEHERAETYYRVIQKLLGEEPARQLAREVSEDEATDSGELVRAGIDSSAARADLRDAVGDAGAIEDEEEDEAGKRAG